MKARTLSLKLNLEQVNQLVRDADRLFERAAQAWVRGNNSGNNAFMKRCDAKCDAYRRRAETLLNPLGITVHYPGLYPSFTVEGFEYYTTESAVSATLKAGAL